MAALPITLVLVSAILSGLYKSSFQFRLTKNQQHKATYTHAIAIEVIQLLLLLFGSISQYSDIAAFKSGHDFACYGLVVPSSIAISINTGIYIFALLAIDAIDNKIQLGRWRHPLQCQMLLLTRSQLLPWTIWRRGQRRGRLPAGLRSTQRHQSTSPLRSAGSLWSMSYLTPTTSPGSVLSPRMYRSFSEPSTPTWLLFSTTRRDSMPESGSVSRLVSTFEGAPLSLDQALHSPDMGEDTQQTFSIAPTPPSTPDKQSIDLSPSAVTKTTSDAGTSSRDSIDKRGSEASAFFPTPQATPDKQPSVPPSELQMIREDEQKAPTDKPGSHASMKKAARHTAHRAQERRRSRAFV